jgi:hypothetical protein
LTAGLSFKRHVPTGSIALIASNAAAVMAMRII